MKRLRLAKRQRYVELINTALRSVNAKRNAVVRTQLELGVLYEVAHTADQTLSVGPDGMASIEPVHSETVVDVWATTSGAELEFQTTDGRNGWYEIRTGRIRFGRYYS